VAKPFVLGVIADFSGRGGSADLESRLAEKLFLDVDRDGVDDLVARLAPRLGLDLPFAPQLSFASFDGFHPDLMTTRVPALAALVEAHESADDPARVQELLAQAGADVSLGPAGAPSTPVRPSGGGGSRPAPPQKSGSEADLLDSLLEGSGAGGAARPRASRGGDPWLDRLVAEIGDLATDRRDHAGTERRRGAIAAALGERVRAILRHPRFRALEARWLALRRLVRRAETGDALRIRVLDLALEDFAAELAAARGQPAATLLHRLVVESESQTYGGDPFGLLVCDWRIEDAEADLAALRGLGAVAAAGRCRALADAGDSLSGISSALAPVGSEAWRALRGAPEARALALVCPRVLARLPYGASDEPVERFAFEEVGEGDGAEAFAWGSGALAAADAAVEAVAATGSLAALPRFAELADLVLHVRRVGRETVQTGPTERVLSEPEVLRLREAGLLPIAAVRGTDTARLPSLRTLAGSPLVDG
jgi:type VI secretion system protein ImpC